MTRVAVTGATGFVGSSLLETLRQSSAEPLAIVRAGRASPSGTAARPVANIGSADEWAVAFEGADAAVHLMALAHSKFPADVIDAVNNQAAVAAAKGALQAGVSRFIFISTAHVFGLDTAPSVITDDHTAAPKSAYAKAKHRAELTLLGMSGKFPQGLMVIRPPLVYGPHPKGNIARMIVAVKSGIPLPAGALTARRSMVGTANLSGAILAAVKSPVPAGAYLVCDDEALSLPDVLRALGKGLGVKPAIFPLPVSLIRMFSAAPVVGHLVAKMAGELIYDCSRFKEAAGWRPVLDACTGLAQCAESTLAKKHRPPA